MEVGCGVPESLSGQHVLTCLLGFVFSCPSASHPSPIPYSYGGLNKGAHDACPASLTGNLQTNAREGRVTSGTNAQVEMIF